MSYMYLQLIRTHLVTRTHVTPPSLSNAQGFEQIRKIHLDAEQFSVEQNLITPTFKLKRPQLLKHYKEQIDAMYGKKKS